MQRIKKYKIYLLLGLIVLSFGASSFVYAGPDANESGLVICGAGEKGTGNDCQFNDFYILIGNIWDFLLKTILAPVAAIAILFAGFKYVMAQGNPGEIQKAHDIFYYTIVGMLIAFAAWLVVNAILVSLGVDKAGGFNFLG